MNIPSLATQLEKVDDMLDDVESTVRRAADDIPPSPLGEIAQRTKDMRRRIDNIEEVCLMRRMGGLDSVFLIMTPKTTNAEMRLMCERADRILTDEEDGLLDRFVDNTNTIEAVI